MHTLSMYFIFNCMLISAIKLGELSSLHSVESTPATYAESSPVHYSSEFQSVTNAGRGGADNDYSSTNTDSNEDDEKSNPGIQYMITQRMRRVLIDELEYYPSEVDAMDPQIAAVVIERGLTRPSKGMPASWKAHQDKKNEFGTAILKSTKAIRISVIKKLQTVSETVIKSSLTIPILGSSFAILALILLREDVVSSKDALFNIIIKSVNGILKSISKRLKSLKNITKKKAPVPVNVKYLDAIQSPSWIETVKVRAKEIKRSLF